MNPTRLRLALLALAVALLAVQAARLDYAVDDAFISFRYARNLVDGHGLTFNPGEARVEGYSNPLWTLLAALALGLGLDPLAVAHAVGIGAGASTVLLGERLAARAGAGPWSVAAALLLAVNPALVTWSSGGLETASFTAFVTFALLSALSPERSPLATGAALGLASLLRPEGVGAAGLIALAVLLTGGWSGLRRLGPAAWVLLLVVLPHQAWRVAYYDAWLPNTFYAKTGDLAAQAKAGAAYLYDGTIALAGGPLLALAVALAWLHAGRRVLAPLALLAGWGLYVLVVGGDGLPMYRFLVPALPALAAILAVALAGLAAAAGPGRRGVTVTALALAGAMAATAVPGRHGRQSLYLHWDRTVFVPNAVRVGKALAGLVGAPATIALLPAGAIPYYSGLKTLDMLALNDPVVARKQMRFTESLPGHWKYDAESILARRPDYVLLGNVDVTREPRATAIRPSFRVEADLVALPVFLAEYEQVAFPLPDGGWLNCYRRRDAPPPRVEPLRPVSASVGAGASR